MTPVQEPHDEAREELHRGMRGRSFDVLLRCFASAVGADTATLFACEEPDEVHVAATWTRDLLDDPVPARDGLVDRALKGHGALVQSALDRDGYGHRAVAAAFSSDERVLGAIHATFDPPSGQPYGELVWSADSFARLAALCMARDVTVAAALGSASFDALTGCLSFAGAMEVLEAELERSQRRGHRVSCCMIDIDKFKQINDTRGHIEGNRVLAAVGEALRTEARRYDAVGRFGGDEFMIVLPETGGHARRHVAERLRSSIRSTVETTSIPIDSSIGIVEWDGESSAAELVEAADRSMQEAKAHGGARVEAEPVREGAADGLTELTRHLTRPWAMDPGFGPRDTEPR